MIKVMFFETNLILNNRLKITECVEKDYGEIVALMYRTRSVTKG